MANIYNGTFGTLLRNVKRFYGSLKDAEETSDKPIIIKLKSIDRQLEYSSPNELPSLEIIQERLDSDDFNLVLYLADQELRRYIYKNPSESKTDQDPIPQSSNFQVLQLQYALKNMQETNRFMLDSQMQVFNQTFQTMSTSLSSQINNIKEEFQRNTKSQIELLEKKHSLELEYQKKLSNLGKEDSKFEKFIDIIARNLPASIWKKIENIIPEEIQLEIKPEDINNENKYL